VRELTVARYQEAAEEKRNCDSSEMSATHQLEWPMKSLKKYWNDRMIAMFIRGSRARCINHSGRSGISGEIVASRMSARVDIQPWPLRAIKSSRATAGTEMTWIFQVNLQST